MKIILGIMLCFVAICGCKDKTIPSYSIYKQTLLNLQNQSEVLRNSIGEKSKEDKDANHYQQELKNYNTLIASIPNFNWNDTIPNSTSLLNINTIGDSLIKEFIQINSYQLDQFEKNLSNKLFSNLEKHKVDIQNFNDTLMAKLILLINIYNKDILLKNQIHDMIGLNIFNYLPTLNTSIINIDSLDSNSYLMNFKMLNRTIKSFQINEIEFDKAIIPFNSISYKIIDKNIIILSLKDALPGRYRITANVEVFHDDIGSTYTYNISEYFEL